MRNLWFWERNFVPLLPDTGLLVLDISAALDISFSINGAFPDAQAAHSRKTPWLLEQSSSCRPFANHCMTANPGYSMHGSISFTSEFQVVLANARCKNTSEWANAPDTVWSKPHRFDGSDYIFQAFLIVTIDLLFAFRTQCGYYLFRQTHRWLTCN